MNHGYPRGCAPCTALRAEASPGQKTAEVSEFTEAAAIVRALTCGLQRGITAISEVRTSSKVPIAPVAMALALRVRVRKTVFHFTTKNPNFFGFFLASRRRLVIISRLARTGMFRIWQAVGLRLAGAWKRSATIAAVGA